jgi:hypothetical protein
MSSRPQRQIKPTQKVIEAQEAAKPAAPRQSRKAKAPAPQAQQAPIEANENEPAPIVLPVDLRNFRGLNLDLSTVPKSKDPKFNPSFNSYENPFWEKFYTPTDFLTVRYREATDSLTTILPATFMLVEDAPESFGVANLELKDKYVKPIVNTPSFSKLKNKEYQTQQTKSDENISASIKFFTNQLPSFQKYQNVDDISWVVKQHRLLVIEIFEYYANIAKLAEKDKNDDKIPENKKHKKPSIATIKSRFNAITRIFRIAYQTKNYDLYEKYSGLVIFLGQHFELDEFKNELSELELQKFVHFDKVFEIQQKLQKQFEKTLNKQTRIAYDLNQQMLLVSLYSLIPPLRNEIKTLRFATSAKSTGDWIIIKPDGFVIMDLNEEKKRHELIIFELSKEAPELARLVKESYDLYPREYVFTPLKKYPDVSKQASVSSMDDRLIKAFVETGKKVSVNSLRSSYVSYLNSEAIKNGKQLTVAQKSSIYMWAYDGEMNFPTLKLRKFPHRSTTYTDSHRPS